MLLVHRHNMSIKNWSEQHRTTNLTGRIICWHNVQPENVTPAGRLLTFRKLMLFSDPRFCLSGSVQAPSPLPLFHSNSLCCTGPSLLLLTVSASYWIDVDLCPPGALASSCFPLFYFLLSCLCPLLQICALGALVLLFVGVLCITCLTWSCLTSSLNIFNVHLLYFR